MTVHLYWRGEPTRALRVLKDCAVKPYGVPYPFKIPGHTFIQNQIRTLPYFKLFNAGYITHTKGKRGGERFVITERGKAALYIVEHYPPGPAQDLALKLAGLTGG